VRLGGSGGGEPGGLSGLGLTGRPVLPNVVKEHPFARDVLTWGVMTQLSKLLVFVLIFSGGAPDLVLCIGSQHGPHLISNLVHSGSHGEEEPEAADGEHAHHRESGTCPRGDCVDTPLPRVIATLSAPLSLPELQVVGPAMDQTGSRTILPATAVVLSPGLWHRLPIPEEPLLRTCRMII